jgi:hypothetical protein
MKTKLLAALLCISIYTIKAQNLHWANTMGGNYNDISRSVAVDASGNVYTTGYFEDTVDFDPSGVAYNLIASGGTDLFISKLDVSGNFVWAKAIGGSGYENSYSVAIDADGYVYVTGVFQDTVDFDPGAGIEELISTSSDDIFILKLSPAGNLVWVKQVSGLSYSMSNAIAIDPWGNVLTTGWFNATTDFDPSAGTFSMSPLGSTDIFVSKLDSAGNFKWAVSLGGTSEDRAHAIATDAKGNVFTTGAFNGIADFDPSGSNLDLTSSGYDDIFISKLDSAGDFLWAGKMGSTAFDIGYSLSIDPWGSVIYTGTFGWATDFDPGAGTYTLTPSGGYEDAFIAKLDSAGNFEWARQIGGSNVDVGYGVTTDAFGNVLATGTFTYNGDFDPGAGLYTLNGAGGIDVYISKLDSAGNFLSAASVGGTSYDYGYSIAVDASDNIHLTGILQDAGDLDPGPGTSNFTTAGFQDIFVLKFNFCSVNASVTQNGTTLTSNSATGSYQWYNCGTNLPVGGEIAQSFTPSANGSYAVIVTDGSCIDTSNCFNINNVGLMEIADHFTFSLNPNPFSEKATLHTTKNMVNASLRVYNIYGQIVKEINGISGNQTVVYRDNLSNGVYFIKLIQENKTISSGKLIITNELR